MTTDNTAQTAPNLYQMIHKAIRLNLCEYLLLLGRSDATQAEDRHRLVAEWTRLKSQLDNHALHEDTHVHPMLERADLNLAMLLCAQHTDFDHALAALEKALLALEGLNNADDQNRALHAIYLDYSAMMAGYFCHLVIEETRAMSALAAAYPLPELLAVHGRLRASIPPAEMLDSMADMARSVSLPELIMMMQGTRAGAPPVFADAAMRRVEAAVAPATYSAVCRALEAA